MAAAAANVVVSKPSSGDGYTLVAAVAGREDGPEVQQPEICRHRKWAVAGVIIVASGYAGWSLGGLFTPFRESSVHRLSGKVSLVEEACSEDGADCRSSKCCRSAGSSCFEKNAGWASCLATCDPGLNDMDKDGLPWSCKLLSTEGLWRTSIARAESILKNLSVEDKVSLLRGQNDVWPADRHGYAGFVGIGHKFTDAWEAKGVMPLTMNDGPQGYNSYGRFAGESTQYPALLNVASSFSPAVARNYATAIAEEFQAKGSNVLLGPDVEVTRSTLTGRSFETLSGEDPYLGATLVAPFVKAVQDHGIIACVKHFLDNNQEIFRQSLNVEVEDRTQFEIYLPVFKAAFEAGAAAVMCSYNKVYGHYACENSKLLTTLLREDLGFKGFVVSDWGATHDALRSSEAGLDIDMQKDDPNERLPDSYHKLPDLLKAGEITEKSLDEKAIHVLSAMGVAGQFDGRFPVPKEWPTDSFGEQRSEQKKAVRANTRNDEHLKVAFDTIVAGAVLLKNKDSVLPLSTTGLSIAMVGKYCDETKDYEIKQGDVYSGGGSGYVDTDKTISPLKGLQARLGAGASLISANDETGAGVADADVAIICVAAHSEEGWDREDYVLPDAEKLVSGLRAQSPSQKIVVLASLPGAVTTEWLDEADALMVLFEPGEQVGPAAAALLMGDESPGGRLPVSFPKPDEKRWEKSQYPGECPPPVYWCPNMTTNFSEGTLVGYRWNDAKDVPSAFPFGSGMDYTSFEFSGFAVECKLGRPLVTMKVHNVGKRAGHAVPLLFVGFPSLAPVQKQLRGFQKVFVAPGKSQKVAFHLDTPDWSFYDEKAGRWSTATERGETITASVGSTSADMDWTVTLPTCVSEDSSAFLAK